MKVSVKANEKGVMLVRLDGKVVWCAPIDASVHDFEIEVTPVEQESRDVTAIKCFWVEL